MREPVVIFFLFVTRKGADGSRNSFDGAKASAGGTSVSTITTGTAKNINRIDSHSAVYPKN
jgi:hypothetical protein